MLHLLTAPTWTIRSLYYGRKVIEVRDSRTGYFIHVRYGIGVWPDGRVVGASSPSSSLASVGNSDPKYVNFEFCSEIPSSGSSHSIRLVKLVSKNSARAKINNMFGPKNNFPVKNPKIRPNSLTSIGLPGFYRYYVTSARIEQAISGKDTKQLEAPNMFEN